MHAAGHSRGQRGTDHPEQSHSLPEQAYAELRERIMRGSYPQASRLPEQRLAEELHISRIPLREAISQLEVDGFVHSERHRGAVVTTWTAQTVGHLFDVRLGLEVAAAGHAAVAAAAGHDVSALGAALTTSEDELAAGDPLRFAEASAAFHEAIVAVTGNELMLALMRAISGRIAWLFYLTSQRDAATACSEHHELVEAITAGNPRVAEAIAYAHIEKGRTPSIGVMEQLE